MSTLPVVRSNVRLGDCVRQLADSLADLSWLDSHEIDREVETVLAKPPAPRVHHNIQPNDISSDDSESDLSNDSESDSEDDTPPSLSEDEETSSDSDGHCEDSTPFKVCETTEIPVAKAHCLGDLMRRQERYLSPKLHSTSFDDDASDAGSSSSNFENVYSISWLFGEDEQHNDGHKTLESSVPQVGSLCLETEKVSVQLKIDVRSLEALTLVEDSVNMGQQTFGRNKSWHLRAWKQLKKLFTCCIKSSED
ncbi:hypothetical protein Bbelb_361150 [Branchiostoma belcheri]|nr:hypothetical protein Bbelb_361150 [Branchiostoma belcheri]